MNYSEMLEYYDLPIVNMLANTLAVNDNVSTRLQKIAEAPYMGNISIKDYLNAYADMYGIERNRLFIFEDKQEMLLEIWEVPYNCAISLYGTVE